MTRSTNRKQGDFMKKSIVAILITVGILFLIGLGSVSFFSGKYNSFVAMGQNVDKSWSQVENVLQRRNDLIPNLVATVQGYAIQEQEVFIKVAQARNQAMAAKTIDDKIKANQAVSGALFTLMATVERYPEIKSNQNFMALQDELAGTENRIAVERKRYNDSVQEYNTFAKSFPNNMLAGLFHQPAEREFFKADDGAKTAPKVQFNVAPQAAPGATPPLPAPAAPAQ
jgi:LemA protein